MSTAFDFTLAEETEAARDAGLRVAGARCVPGLGGACGWERAARGTWAWGERGESARGAGLRFPLRLLPPAAAAVQFSRNPTGAAFAERMLRPGGRNGLPWPVWPGLDAGRGLEEGARAGGGEGRGQPAWP